MDDSKNREPVRYERFFSFLQISLKQINCFRFNENCWKKAYAEENDLNCPSDIGQVWKYKVESKGQENEWLDAGEDLQVNCAPGKITFLLYCGSFTDY